MKRKHTHWIGAACAFVLSIGIGTAVAQGPSSTPAVSLPKRPYAMITYPSADSATQSASVVSPCANGIFALVGLQPGQVIQVVVQYPTTQALQIVNLEALDGGMILPPSSVNVGGTTTISVGPTVAQLLQGVLIPATPQVATFIISADGTLTFTFVATNDPGKNQISLRQGSQELGLQFWVFDLQDPQNNPPAITPSDPYPSE